MSPEIVRIEFDASQGHMRQLPDVTRRGECLNNENGEQENTGRASGTQEKSPAAAVGDKEPQVECVLGCRDETIAFVHGCILSRRRWGNKRRKGSGSKINRPSFPTTCSSNKRQAAIDLAESTISLPVGVGDHSRWSLRMQRTTGKVKMKICTPRGVRERLPYQRFSYP